jgi:hypothetical protein
MSNLHFFVKKNIIRSLLIHVILPTGDGKAMWFWFVLTNRNIDKTE